MNSTKFIFITGGVLSSLGKGITASALGALLEARGLTVTFQKLDPYLNVDPGTMSPFQHGEVYVLDDGTETDLDLGHYERFCSVTLDKASNYTSGKIWFSVIEKERRGEYLGQTVQVVPHITNEIKDVIMQLKSKADVAIIEIGGTVGDIEAQPFYEAIRQLRLELDKEDTLLVHVTHVPYLKSSKELKTKPTQHSVKELRKVGLVPDILVCRAERKLNDGLKKKIAMFCSVHPQCVISAVDCHNIYEVVLKMHSEGLDQCVINRLNMWTAKPNLEKWKDFIKVAKSKNKPIVKLAMVGKYVALTESYKSLNEALYHAAIANDIALETTYIDSEKTRGGDLKQLLAEHHGILVPGGFGRRGIEGKIEAIQYARENNVPYLGICLGMQLAVIEFARNVAGIEGADSEEFNASVKEPVVHLAKEWFNYRTGQIEKRDKHSALGATMRLGAYPCCLEENTLAREIYNTEQVSERHRHRYEFNNKYMSALEEKGLIYSGLSPDKELVEIVEIKDHPWFIGCQFHPEFKSKPFKPHPLFVSFIQALKNNKEH